MCVCVCGVCIRKHTVSFLNYPHLRNDQWLGPVPISQELDINSLIPYAKRRNTEYYEIQISMNHRHAHFTFVP